MYHPWCGEAARGPELWSRGATVGGGRRRGSPPARELDPRPDAGPDGAALSPTAGAVGLLTDISCTALVDAHSWRL